MITKNEEKIEEEFDGYDENTEHEYNPDSEFENEEVYFTELLCDSNGIITSSTCGIHDKDEIYVPTVKKSKGQILLAFKSQEQLTDEDERNIVSAVLMNPIMKSQIEVKYGIRFFTVY